MVELEVKDNPHFEASCIEADRNCPTYAGDTIRHYKAQIGNAAEVLKEAIKREEDAVNFYERSSAVVHQADHKA